VIGFALAAASALGLGVLTSISPCPLATNIVAISYIGRRVGNLRHVFWSGLLYAIGRTAVYVVLGQLLVAGLLSAPGLSLLLQKQMDRLLGPILILVGMVVLRLIRTPTITAGMSDAMRHRVDALGIWGAGLLGIVFALSFCPVSAALFFVSLPLLAVKYGSRVVLPWAYGIGTALPVMAFAMLIAARAQSLGRAFDCTRQIEWWARQAAGGLFVLVGVYYCLKFIFLSR
jgi:hypothetical protein